MSDSRPTNGPGGPFSGHEIRGALEELGWQLIAGPNEHHVAGFRHDGIDNEVWVALDKQVYYGDPFFLNTARTMVSRILAGRTRREAVEAQMRLLRDTVVRRRAKGRPYDPEGDE